jgi:hypothetical protein
MLDLTGIAGADGPEEVGTRERVIWRPYPKQSLWLRAARKVTFTLAGGARGPGKTEAGIVYMIDHHRLEFPRYNGQVIRQDDKDLTDWLARSAKIYQAIGGEWRDYVDASLGEDSASYEVEIYSSNTYVTLKRTITATSPNTPSSPMPPVSASPRMNAGMPASSSACVARWASMMLAAS